MKRIFICLILTILPLLSVQAAVNIIPAPEKVTEGKGTFQLKSGMTIGYNDATLKDAADYLVELLTPATGYLFRTKEGAGAIRLELTAGADPKDERYTLKVSKKKVVITAGICRWSALGGCGRRHRRPLLLLSALHGPY